MKRISVIFIILFISFNYIYAQGARFGIGISGGYSYLSMGDFDKTATYWNALGQSYKMFFPSTDYDTDSPNNGLGGEVNFFIIPISSIMLSFSAGYISSSAKIYKVNISDGADYLNMESSVETSVIPIIGTLYYRIPVSPEFKLNLGGGLGGYLGKIKFNEKFSGNGILLIKDLDGNLVDEVDGGGDFTAAGVGFHATLEGELSLSDSISLCFELLARIASISGFTGDITAKSTTGGSTTTKTYSNIKLVMVEVPSGFFTTYETFSTDKMADQTGYDYRDLEADFSGITLRIGLRFYI